MPQVDEGVLILLLGCMQKECLSYIKLTPKSTEIARFFRANERNTKETKYHALFRTVTKKALSHSSMSSVFFSFLCPQCMLSLSVMSASLRPHGLYSPGQNTGVGSLSLLQQIFPARGSNPGLLHCRWILYQLNHKGSPRILEWVAYPFSRGSSPPRDQTWVACIAGEFFAS